METQQGVGNKGISTFLSFGAKNVQPDILEKMLVGRQKTVNLLEQYAREIALNGVNHQVFIVGPRGAGKTHMLRVLYYRINDFVQRKDIVVSYFAEEEYGISGYLDFLIRIINAFMRWYDDERPVLETQLNILRETPESRQEYVAETIISDFVGDKPLLILSENFDTILEALGKDGQSKLRAWLYRHNRISIIATAQATSPDLGREDRPFYAFFSTISLKKLNYEESLELLRNLAEIEKNPAMIEHLAGKGQSQVRAIHELIKGNHRLLVTFYEFLKANSLADLSAIFMKTMNDLKPYYETFIRFLPAQQQKILHYLALAKIPQKGTDIGKNCFIATASLTKQLSELQRQNLIDALPDPADKRNKLYDVSEPLLRIAIEIGEQREGITTLFIDFLALYYSHDEIKGQKEQFEELYQREEEPLKKQKLYWEVEARDRALQLKSELASYFPKLSPNQDVASSTNSNYLEIGNKYFEQGLYEQAIKAYQKAIRVQPSDNQAWYSLGITYAKQGLYDKVIEAYQKAVQIKLDYHEAWYNLGFTYAEQGLYDKAIEAYQKAIQIKPNYHEASNNLGFTYYRQGLYKHSFEAYQKAIQIKPDLPQAWYGLGLVYIEQELYDKAMEAYQKAVQIKPDYYQAWYNLGITYANRGLYDKAVEAFRKAIQIKFDLNQAWCSLGLTYHYQQLYSKAIEAYHTAIQIKPNDHITWYNLGNTYYEQELYEQAIETYQKTLQIKLDFYEAWYNLGSTYTMQEFYNKAVEAYQKAYETNSTDRATIDKLVEIITLHLQTQTATKAEAELNDLEKWLQKRTDFEIISTYVTTYRRVIFNNDEKALYELPKEQRIFFEREILKRSTE